MLIVLSLFTLVAVLAGHAATSRRDRNSSLLEQAALAGAAGILLDYCLVLSGLGLTQVLVAMAVLAAWGLVRAAPRLWARLKAGAGGFRAGLASAGVIAYILGIYYLVVLSEPLKRWDARSIWFFHARMIWTEGGLRRHGGWAHPSIAFSHPDYPNLVPAIAAQLGWMKGFWNEFLPKGSLVVMLVPLALWIFTFRQRLGSLILVALFCFFSLDGWLSNGYMDGYMALYAGIGLMLFGRYLSAGREADLYSAVCALGITAALKNEGLLVALCFTAALLLVGLAAPRALGATVRRLARDRVFATVLLLALAPEITWALLKHAWGVHNDITADVAVNWSRLVTRLSDGTSVSYLLEFLATRATAAWLLVVLVGLAALVQKVRRVPLAHGALVAALTAVLYFCAMCFVYLVTPYDMGWHLLTSAGRTMLTVSVGLLVSLYLLLHDERPGDEAPAG